MPDRAYTVTIDPELQPGARNAIRDCLRLKPDERIRFMRQFSSKAQHVVGDKQGRIVLPDEQCKLLNLRNEVVLVGNYSRFEIWVPEMWQKATEEDAQTFSYLMDRIGI